MQQHLVDIADTLNAARRGTYSTPPPTDKHPNLALGEALAIQRHNVARRLPDGERVAGYKLGNIAKAMQAAFGVDQPDYGHLLSGDFRFENLTVQLSDFVAPFAEVEPAFLLGRRLEGPGVTVADVIRATECVQPAIEIIDSRVTDWRITRADTIADNGSTGGLVLSARPRHLRDVDFSTMQGQLHYGQQLVGSGPTSAILGNPVAAVAWLCNELAQYQIAFEPGHTILAGSCLEAVPLRQPTTVSAQFTDWGQVQFDAV